MMTNGITQFRAIGNFGIGADTTPDTFFDCQGAAHFDGAVTMDSTMTLGGAMAGNGNNINDIGDLSVTNINLGGEGTGYKINFGTNMFMYASGTNFFFGRNDSTNTVRIDIP